MTVAATQPLASLADDGEFELNFHDGQMAAWNSVARIVLVLAGTQGGKSSFGPYWMLREIQQKGPGDYMVVAPTFPLLALKSLPEFLKVFRAHLGWGQFSGSPIRQFRLNEQGQRQLWGKVGDEQTTVYFGHAQDPDSLEAATAKAAWLDEAGQNKFKLGSWEALQRRLAIHQGRVLITTTPYSLGWLKQQVWDRWRAGDQSIDVVSFESIMNPAFPREEYDRARRTLPRWKFDMFYRGLFTRPAGMIYDCFDDQLHKCPRFTVPPLWRRYLGLDFGGVNTAGVFFAEEPGTGRCYAYREYHAGGRTAKDHAVALLKDEPGIPYCVGGSKSEGQWRDEFRAGGLPVREPLITDVEVGIDRVYGAIKTDNLVVFDDLTGLLDELGSYSRELDANGNPTEKIEDKEAYHRLDAVRYIMGWVRRGAGPISVTAGKSVVDSAPRGVFGSSQRESPVF